MLKLGIIGLGKIAQKAYLPYMRQLDGIEWHISTRQQATLRDVEALFPGSVTYNDYQDLVSVDLDGVFIHAATKVHYQMATLFLERGIPVYMDKPLSESYKEVAELYALAEANQTFLMAGFNRRFAPGVKELSSLSTKRKVLVEKNDSNRPGEFVFKVFDFFIHPIDTALFLTGEMPKTGCFSYQLEGENICQATVNLATENTIIMASMNLQSGSRREVMEVQGPEKTMHLENLDQLTVFKGNHQEKISFSDWDTTLYKRGFESIISAFIDGIKSSVNPVNNELTLMSHWICQQIVNSEEASGLLDLTLPN
ncbi:Gfo/Idh/MocA family protein [Streptococcus pseudoporcinus]|uniref:Oxidoreductase n=1 Tax=Streptococcus pseudoporcinus TaxID=361101 RepID=A0A4U9YIX4_9STRE|nr:Gfo/Idh/MocA family oxidoreductase [Streptococcus pseudoporcinus]VTS26074.1 oxidoreductase [Streptococcus pseudoporcinus]VUC71605.1 oxidoreductase [Streptococcus pseudoporcinus]VUD00913.1 oxidoreductase [Streptococcus pseudoporcinus]VUD01211.1 oxidoreductase [Streptococcus pseudoporcinus]